MYFSEMAYNIPALILMTALVGTEGSIADSLRRCYYSLGYKSFWGRMGTLSPSFIGSLFRFFSFFSVISLGKLFLYFSLYVSNLKAKNLLTSGVVLKFLLGMTVIFKVHLKYPYSLSTFHPTFPNKFSLQSLEGTQLKLYWWGM